MLETILKIWKTGTVAPKRSLPEQQGARRGTIDFDSVACLVCGNCEHACPTEAIRIGGAPRNATMDIQYDKCLFCGMCVASCGNQALLQTNELRIAARTRDELRVRKGSAQ